MRHAEPFTNFHAAAQASLAFLREQLGFDLAMFTRVDGDEWLVLHADDQHYGVSPGDVFSWSDSMCSRMVEGLGPRVAPRAAEVPAYAAAPIAGSLQIGAYAGVPLTRPDGSLFGTLCAVHPDPKQATLVNQLPVLELVSRLLISLFNSEMAVSSERRRAERAETEAMTDALTGLYNRRGWDLLTESEEGRCARYGHSACVLSIDLDGLKAINDRGGHAEGDLLLQRAGHAIRASLREHDIAARTGGDEFLVLGVECGGPDARILRRRVADALKAADVRASVGMARRNPKLGLDAATREADTLMYARKAARRKDDPEDGRLKLAA